MSRTDSSPTDRPDRAAYVIDFDAWRRYHRLVRHPLAARAATPRRRSPPENLYRPDRPPLVRTSQQRLGHSLDIVLGLGIAATAAIPIWPVAAGMWRDGITWSLTEAVVPVFGLFVVFGTGLAAHGACALVGHRQSMAT